MWLWLCNKWDALRWLRYNWRSDLRVCLRERKIRKLEEALANMRQQIIALGYHAAGCGVFEGGNSKTWPTREAYLCDEKCTCGLTALARVKED